MSWLWVYTIMCSVTLKIWVFDHYMFYHKPGQSKRNKVLWKAKQTVMLPDTQNCC